MEVLTLTTVNLNVIQRKIRRNIGRRVEFKFKYFIKLNENLIHEFNQGDYETTESFSTKVEMWVNTLIKSLEKTEGLEVVFLRTFE